MDEQIISGNDVMDARPAAESWVSLLYDYAPLFLLGFTMCMLRGLRGLKASYLGKTFLSKMLNLVIRSSIGAGLAVACALIMPLLKINPDPTTMLGVVVFVSVCGVQIVDGLIYKYMGIHLVDSTGLTEEDAQWQSMDMAARRKALEIYKQSLEKQEDGQDAGV